MNQFASHFVGDARDYNTADRRPAPEESPSRGVPNELRNFNQNKTKTNLTNNNGN